MSYSTRNRWRVLAGILVFPCLAYFYAIGLAPHQKANYIHSIQCARNLHSLAHALAHYAMKHKGRLPHRQPDDFTGQKSWLAAIMPFLKNHRHFTSENLCCPGNPEQVNSISYRFNPRLYGKKIADLRKWSQKPILMETGIWHFDSPATVPVEDVIILFDERIWENKHHP